MSKANQSLSGPIETDLNVKQDKKSIAPRMPVVFRFLFFVSMFVVGQGSAAINTTSIIESIDAFIEILPHISDMVSAIVPVVMTLAVVVFVLKFYNQIIDMVGNLTSAFK